MYQIGDKIVFKSNPPISMKNVKITLNKVYEVTTSNYTNDPYYYQIISDDGTSLSVNILDMTNGTYIKNPLIANNSYLQNSNLSQDTGYKIDDELIFHKYPLIGTITLNKIYKVQDRFNNGNSFDFTILDDRGIPIYVNDRVSTNGDIIKDKRIEPYCSICVKIYNNLQSNNKNSFTTNTIQEYPYSKDICPQCGAKAEEVQMIFSSFFKCPNCKEDIEFIRKNIKEKELNNIEYDLPF